MATSKIQVLKPFYRTDECINAIRECLDCGWTGLGFKTNELEDAWKNYTQLPNAHFLNSATAGLHLAIRILKDAYGWEDGDEIITTPLTFVSTNHVILYERLFPAFADVHPDTLCLDPTSVEKKITVRTRAIVYVGVGGNVGHLDEIRSLCKKHNLKLILDGAHMAGTKRLVDGKEIHVGHEADVSVFSFQSVKNMPTADGGMICFSDNEFDAKARKMSWLGIDKNTYIRREQSGTYKWKYDVPEVGFKYHGNSIMAAMGLVALKYLDQDNVRRREIFDIYMDKLGDIPSIKIIDESSGLSSRHLCQVVIDNRDSVLNSLNIRDIYPGVHYIDNTHYRMYRHGMNTCPVAHDLSNKLMTLPIHLHMSNDDVIRVTDSIKEIINGA